MKIIVASVKEIPRINEKILTERHVVVSITTPGMDYIVYPINEKRASLYRMVFDNVDLIEARNNKTTLPKDIVPFVGEMATNLLDWISPHLEHVQYIFCQDDDISCEKAAGVGAALSKLFLGDDESIFGQFKPNRFVYRAILERFYLDEAY